MILLSFVYPKAITRLIYEAGILRTSYMPVATQDSAGEQDESIRDIPVSFCSISKLPVLSDDYSNIFFYSNCFFLAVSFFRFGTKM